MCKKKNNRWEGDEPTRRQSLQAAARSASAWQEIVRAVNLDVHVRSGRLRERFEQNIVGFMDLVEASKHYPCVKTKWVEYLGERPEPAIDRVE